MKRNRGFRSVRMKCIDINLYFIKKLSDRYDKNIWNIRSYIIMNQLTIYLTLLCTECRFTLEISRQFKLKSSCFKILSFMYVLNEASNYL